MKHIEKRTNAVKKVSIQIHRILWYTGNEQYDLGNKFITDN